MNTKKIESSSSIKGAKREEKVRVIAELRAKYPFKMLLKIAGISRLNCTQNLGHKIEVAVFYL